FLSVRDGLPKNIAYTLSVPGAFLMPGDTVNSTDAVTPIAGDIHPLDNSYIHSDTIRSSYDPNEMSITPSGFVSSGTTLTYSIEFENTGNDTAHNVYVLDTLSNSLNVQSAALVASSDNIIFSKTFNGINWVLKFDFPDINLPDSS